MFDGYYHMVVHYKKIIIIKLVFKKSIEFDFDHQMLMNFIKG